MHWNVNGWTANNCDLRKVILHHLNPDFVCLNETHLSCPNIELCGYAWFGHNRVTHRKAVKASGGVGIFVRNSVLEQFYVKIVDKSVDRLLCLRFENRVTLHSFALISCYLPPETSTWGRNAECFFGHLLSLLYRLDVDSFYLCGDFNARISNLKDYIDTDDISPRVALDLNSNKHGEAFIEFLKDAKCCVLNGRLNPSADNFTSVSVRGKAVVDYIVTPHSDIKSCLDMNVSTSSELVDKIGSEALNLIGPQSRLPDHSVLCLTFQIGESVLDR